MVKKCHKSAEKVLKRCSTILNTVINQKLEKVRNDIKSGLYQHRLFSRENDDGVMRSEK